MRQIIEAMDLLDRMFSRWLWWLLRSGERPLDVAKRKGHKDVVELLKAKGGAGLHGFQRVLLAAATCSVQVASPSENDLLAAVLATFAWPRARGRERFVARRFHIFLKPVNSIKYVDVDVEGRC